MNRGVLRGPLCPIYGCGGLLVIFALQDFTENPFSVFCVGCFYPPRWNTSQAFSWKSCFTPAGGTIRIKKFNLNRPGLPVKLAAVRAAFPGLDVRPPPICGADCGGLPEKGLAILFWCVLVIFLADVAAATIDGLKLRQKLSRMNENLEKLKLELQKRNLAGDLSLAKMSAYLKNQGLDDKVKKLILQHKKSITEITFPSAVCARLPRNYHKKVSRGASRFKKAHGKKSK